MGADKQATIAPGAQTPIKLSRNRILTDADIVKPVEPPLTHEDDAPLASLSPRDILGMTVWRAAREAGEPEIRHLFKGDDLTMLQSIVQLPHWIAKQAPAFAKVYERQLRRMDERSAALKKSLETVPSMFGKDPFEGCRYGQPAQIALGI